MTRAKITAYVTEDLADAVKRVAAVKDKSISDVIVDALTQSFVNTSREGEQAVLLERLERITRRLGVIEKGVETHFELTAHATRFVMCMAPDIPELDRSIFNARGSERFRRVLSLIVSRLTAGVSVWRDHFIMPGPAVAPPAAAAHATQATQADKATETPQTAETAETTENTQSTPQKPT
jgi:uncharacterized protein (DUF1778 family)